MRNATQVEGYMELSGNLRESGFAKLMARVGPLEGVLELWNLPRRRSVQLFVKHGRLRCVRVNGAFLDPLQARALLVELAAGVPAAYEFTARSFRTPCNPPLDWPLDRLVLAAVTQSSEHRRYLDRLPDPDRSYRLAPLAGPEGSLFLRAAGGLLQREGGATAREIANELRLPLDQVRYYLHKLRQRDKVEPAG